MIVAGEGVLDYAMINNPWACVAMIAIIVIGWVVVKVKGRD